MSLEIRRTAKSKPIFSYQALTTMGSKGRQMRINRPAWWMMNIEGRWKPIYAALILCPDRTEQVALWMKSVFSGPPGTLLKTGRRCRAGIPLTPETFAEFLKK